MGYRWTGRQTDKVPREQGGEGGLGREEGTRAQIAHPLSTFPALLSQGKHIQCVLVVVGRQGGGEGAGGKMAFLKNSFL